MKTRASITPLKVRGSTLTLKFLEKKVLHNFLRNKTTCHLRPRDSGHQGHASVSFFSPNLAEFWMQNFSFKLLQEERVSPLMDGQRACALLNLFNLGKFLSSLGFSDPRGADTCCRRRCCCCCCLTLRNVRNVATRKSAGSHSNSNKWRPKENCHPSCIID